MSRAQGRIGLCYVRKEVVADMLRAYVLIAMILIQSSACHHALFLHEMCMNDQGRKRGFYMLHMCCVLPLTALGPCFYF